MSTRGQGKEREHQGKGKGAREGEVTASMQEGDVKNSQSELSARSPEEGDGRGGKESADNARRG